MFGGDLPTAKDKEGAYFIEGNGQLFRFVLDFLRRNELCLSECPFYLRYKFSDSYLALLGTDRRCYFDMWVLDERPNNESLVRVRYHSNYIASYSGTSRFALEDLLRRKSCRIRHTSSAADSNGRITHNRWFVPRSFLSNCQNLQYQL